MVSSYVLDPERPDSFGDVAVRSRGLVLVLQYYPGGNVSALLQREGHLPEALAKLYTAEACHAFRDEKEGDETREGE